MKSIAIIGLGKQTQEELIPAILLLKNIRIDVVCDPDASVFEQIKKILPNVRLYTNNDDVFEHKHALDGAFICVPHYKYAPLIAKFLKKHIPVFKEKPLAMNSKEAQMLCTLSDRMHTPLYTITKRSHFPSYLFAQRHLVDIGVPYQFYAKHFIPHGSIYTGWRSEKKYSGGGVLLDLGYHLIDILTIFFGEPSSVSMVSSNKGAPGYIYSVEDAATVLFTYSSGIHGCFQVGCLSGPKDEMIEIRGSNGTIVVRKDSCTLYDGKGKEIVHKFFPTDSILEVKEIIREFFSLPKTAIKKNQEHHKKLLNIISSAYHSQKIV